MEISPEVFDNRKLNKLCEYFLLVPSNHSKYDTIISETKKQLSNPEFSGLLSMYITNHFEMPNITPARELDSKIILIKDLLTEDNKVDILSDLRLNNKVVKQFMNDPSQKVRQVVFSRLKIKDKETELFELEHQRYNHWRGFTSDPNGDKYRNEQLIKLLKDKLVDHTDIPNLLKYLDKPGAPFTAYWDLFHKYIEAAPKSELGRILEAHPNLPFSWKTMINRRLGLVADPKDKEKYLKEMGDMARQFRMMYGDRDKKLN